MTLRCAAWVICVSLLAAIPAPAAEPRYAKMPWHLVDIWWDLGRDTPFESLAIDISIEGDAPDEIPLYLAPVGLAKLGGTQFYGGLQTRADGNTADNPRLQSLGRGLLMSMWGERSTAAIRPGPGGFFQSSGHEGDFVSVRMPYVWRAGKYTYRVARMDRETIEGRAYTWVGAFLESHARGEHVFIGALRFPGENLTLQRSVANFVEIYGSAIPPSKIPRLKVQFGNVRVNGESRQPVSVLATYPTDVPDFAEAKFTEGRVEINVGEAVAGRKQRRVELYAQPPRGTGAGDAR